MSRPAPWSEAPLAVLAGIDVVLTDVDDTITDDGRLPGAALEALEDLRAAGIRVVPVTAASAGWGSAMISMWPVAAVIAENGGVVFRRRDGRAERSFPEPEAPARLNALRSALSRAFPALAEADDQPYREASLAFRRPTEEAVGRAVLAWLEERGWGGVLNSLWLLAFPGAWTKKTAALALLEQEFGLNPEADLGRVIHVGDSENDEPLFAHLPHSVGVSTVARRRLSRPPRWITVGGGGSGFVEAARRIVAARRPA